MARLFNATQNLQLAAWEIAGAVSHAWQIRRTETP